LTCGARFPRVGRGSARASNRSPGPAGREGVSVYCRDESGEIFHTYSSSARGIDILNTAYHYLDLVPKGRDEHGRNQFWVQRRDEYARAGVAPARGTG